MLPGSKKKLCICLFVSVVLNCIYLRRSYLMRLELQIKILKEPEDIPERHANDAKLFIILVTGYRTGSTYLGELFNQNPEIQYHFEPFHHQTLYNMRDKGYIPGSTERSTTDELQLMWLEQVLEDCNTGEDVLYPEYERYGRCNDAERGGEKCSRAEICRRRGVVVFKVIRLAHIESLLRIPGLVQYNLKIIHLIRDPRDIIHSQLKFSHFYYKTRFPVSREIQLEAKLSLAAEDLCKKIMDDINFIEKRAPYWLKERYLRISQESVSENPHLSALKIYSFLSLTLPIEVQSWIQHKGRDKIESPPLFEKKNYVWNDTYTGLVEEECKELIIEMRLPFKTININYSEF